MATEFADGCGEDNHKINILEACDNVEKMPSELTPATKETLKRAADPSAKTRLETFGKVQSLPSAQTKPRSAVTICIVM